VDASGRLCFFHRPDDPWSHLLLQLLPRLLETYHVDLECVTVPFPDPVHAPRPELLACHALRDARDLCDYHELDFRSNGQLPAEHLVEQASLRLLTTTSAKAYLELANRLGTALFAGEPIDCGDAVEHGAPLPDSAAARRQLHVNHARLLAAGHYLSGMIAFRGNWYWGVDRLSHLEHDLLAAGLRRADRPVGLLQRRPPEDWPRELPPALRVLPPQPDPDDGRPVIDWFCSFRSPYAYLSAGRTFDLARRYPVRIRPRLIIPMKMAGFAIPDRKRDYFRMDPAREALRHGVRFGNFCDPFGEGLERAMAAVPVAERAGRLEQYVMSVMTGVWADGIDTASEVGLRTLVERAGIDWSQVRPVLQDDGWREWADRNREELAALGQYAAPTYRFGDWVTWGQDRVWMLEQKIRAALGLRPAM
jgi:2-hydroxychromene-2-carboxylate isomerase